MIGGEDRRWRSTELAEEGAGGCVWLLDLHGQVRGCSAIPGEGLARLEDHRSWAMARSRAHLRWGSAEIRRAHGSGLEVRASGRFLVPSQSRTEVGGGWDVAGHRGHVGAEAWHGGAALLRRLGFVRRQWDGMAAQGCGWG